MKDNIKISASILSANFTKLQQEVTEAKKAGVHAIHFDVMDNHFVPNLTFGPSICADLSALDLGLEMDVHLMTDPVDSLVKPFAKAGAHVITFHPEATAHVDRTIQLIKSCGCEVGIALNPSTSLHCLDHILPQIDRVLLMSVNPGFGGQSFIDYVYDKIRTLDALIASKGLTIPLQIDGGVSLDNIKKIYECGIRNFVMGTAFFKSGDYGATIQSIHDQLSGH